jgi:hypothetical protein
MGNVVVGELVKIHFLGKDSLRYLFILSTQVSSKCLFPVASNVMISRRESLLSTSIERLMFLNKNMYEVRSIFNTSYFLMKTTTDTESIITQTE